MPVFQASKRLFDKPPGKRGFEESCVHEEIEELPLARWFFKQMLAGLEYCHNKGVAHRDLKPENCLLGDGFLIKLVDFGFATVFKGESGMEQKMLTALGTPGYAAPKILKRKKYTKNVDIFSLGVILFITIPGFPPFQEAKPDNDWWFHK